MKSNKLDNSIKEKFANRTFTPSASAWERLSDKLDERPKKKRKGWFFYIGVAASLALLISVGVSYFGKTHPIEPVDEIIVVNPIDTTSIQKNIDKVFKKSPIEEAIVNNNRIEEKQNKTLNKKKNVVNTKEKSLKRTINNNKSKQNTKTVIAQVEANKTEAINENNKTLNSIDSIKKKTLKQDPKSRIKINSDDLLYAVTHSPEEVKAYYAKYNVNRDDVLKTIKSELKKSNIKINPNTILAEVERSIDDDDFQNNFMKSLKKRVSDIASAIASRND